MPITEVDFKTRAARVRSVLEKTIEIQLQGHSDEVAGFAVVTWDGRGACLSGFFTGAGPIDRCLMPSYVEQALNRHVAANIANETEAEIIHPDEPA